MKKKKKKPEEDDKPRKHYNYQSKRIKSFNRSMLTDLQPHMIDKHRKGKERNRTELEEKEEARWGRYTKKFSSSCCCCCCCLLPLFPFRSDFIYHFESFQLWMSGERREEYLKEQMDE